jgi:branched-chain amino acid transport system substrate-binding protein
MGVSVIARLAVRGAAVGLAFAAVAAFAQEPIRIGAFLSVTGPAAFLGDPEQKMLEMYVERLNAAGGINARKLALTVYDDAGDAEKARTFTKRLIEQDRVDVIVGDSTISDRAYVLETGRVAIEGTGRNLLGDPRVREAYLGL